MDYLANQCHAQINRIKFKALVGDAELGGKRVLLMKPQTFMNLSGQSVQEAMAFYKIPPERTVIIFDDISLPPGRLRTGKRAATGDITASKYYLPLRQRYFSPH